MTDSLSRQFPRYIVISPVRDEAEHLPKTIASMVQQTVRPSTWILVNDGSTDATGDLIESWGAKEPWIVAVHRGDRGFRKSGGGVVEAFYDGYERVGDSAWEFLVKLDGDLSFPPTYFEQCFREFRKDATMGIGGGNLCHPGVTGKQADPHPWFHVRGATKIYRRACWEEIGGLWRGPGWDTIDEMKANMLGWSTRTFPNIEAFHHRTTGGAEGGWRDNVKNGAGSYIAGYHPLYVLFRCIRRARLRPYVIGSLGMLYGYQKAYRERAPRIEDPRLVNYVRQQQLNRLLGRPTIWT